MMTRDEIVKALDRMADDFFYENNAPGEEMAFDTMMEILKLLPVKPDGTIDTDAIVGYGTGTGPREVK